MVMGPTCGMILADLGAEVIKVEPPGRRQDAEAARAWAWASSRSFNRNKKSVVLDIQSPDGIARGQGADRHEPTS